MPDIEDFETEADRGDTTDDDSHDQAAKRLQSLGPWQWPLAFGPFVLVIIFANFHIANSIPIGLFVVILIVAAVWAVVFKGYLLYLNYQK